jgi:tetraacyldisaccharide 4'-kinase
MFLLRLLLFPFSLLYFLATRVRNYLFDIGYSRSISFDVCVISVGNLVAGGSGKTPMVEYLLQLFKDKYPTATLSRGYGRKTRGFKLAAVSDNSKSIGDEAYQIFKKYGKAVKVAVGEERILAVPMLLQEVPDTKLIILDDAFQHRQIKPHYNILLTEYSRPFFSDYILPTGNLREARRGASRADVIIVTKCPAALSTKEKERYTLAIRAYAEEKTPIFFSFLMYSQPIKISGQVEQIGKDIVLLTGIANPEPLKQFLQDNGYNIHKHFDFADHHAYVPSDLEKIKQYLDKNKTKLQVITTEKDMVKLIDPENITLIEKHAFFYLPVKMKLLNDGSIFDNLLHNVISNFYNAGLE